MLKRCVFRDDLKLSIGWLVLTASSNEFQAIQAAELKDDLRHWLFLKCAGGIALFVDDLRVLECVLGVTSLLDILRTVHCDTCILVGIVYTVFFLDL